MQNQIGIWVIKLCGNLLLPQSDGLKQNNYRTIDNEQTDQADNQTDLRHVFTFN